MFVVNPKFDEIQGIKTHNDVAELPQTDLAIIAIAAKFCPLTVKTLANEKGTRGFIILSAGFSEENTKTWLPVYDNWKKVNAEQQLNDSNSLLQTYKQLLTLKNEGVLFLFLQKTLHITINSNCIYIKH